MAESSNSVKKNKKKLNLSLNSISTRFKKWAYENRIYLLAFFIPVIILYTAYVMFDVYPFGDHSVLVLDLNGQYVYFFEGLRDAFWGDESILYSWRRNLSGEFMGMIGYYLASPFTLIVMLLPRTMILGSILIMQHVKIGAASVAFCLFLQKTRGSKPVNALIFSIMYSLMAYAVIQLMDPMWIDGVVFLPLIIWGIELLVDSKKKINYIIPLAIMFFANFYIGFMIAIFCFIYFIYYVFFGSTKMQKKSYERFTAFIKFGFCSVVAAMCAAVMLLPVYYALQLGKFDFSNPDYSFKLHFTALDFFQKLLPNSYDTVRNEGLPDVYCGVLTLLLLPLFYMNNKIESRQKMGHTILLLVMFFSMYIKPIDMMWHGGQSPNWLPFRYSFIFSFILLSIAAITFNNLEGLNKKSIFGSCIGIIGYLLYVDKVGYDNIETVSTIWFTIAFLLAFSLLLSAIIGNPKSKVLPILLLIFVSGEMLVTSYQSFKDIDEDVAYSKHSSYYDTINDTRYVVEQIEKNDSSLFRSDKTYRRMSNDNFAVGLKGMTHTTSVMNSKILDFLGTLGYNHSSYYSTYANSIPTSDSLLGFKYILEKKDQSPQKVSELYDPTWEYEDIVVYQNPNALSIGYMADAALMGVNELNSVNPFENQNTFLGTIVDGTSKDYYKPIELDGEPVLRNVRVEAYGDQLKYVKDTNGQNLDTTLEYQFYVENDEPVYMYLYTRNQLRVNLWVSTEMDEATGEFVTGKFKSYGQYFEGYFYHAMNLGSFTPGQKVAVRLTIPSDKEYTIIKEPYFYYLDTELYEKDMQKLKGQQLNISDWSDTKIEGTIEADAGQIMLTSIPYEPGWTVKVDGKKVEPIVIANALIGVPLSKGIHEIELSFVPKGFIPGVILMILGIGICIFIYLHDNKKIKI